MDTNQVVMVELFLAKESFLEYPPSLPREDIELGISLKSMKKFCATLTEDPLTFRATARQINLIQKYTGGKYNEYSLKVKLTGKKKMLLLSGIKFKSELAWIGCNCLKNINVSPAYNFNY